MDNNNEITHDFSPFFKVYKDGRIERYMVLDDLPAGLDPESGVLSKDVVISPESGVKARIFIPETVGSDQKLPLLVHYHGGGFCAGSAFHILTKHVLTSTVSQGNVIAISIDYRLAPEHLLPIAYTDSWDGLEWIAAPEHPIPTGYEDSWTSLQWVASHANRHGAEPWLNFYGDFSRVFLAGDSAGANIAYYLAVRIRSVQPKMRLAGMILMHPFFMGSKLDRMWFYLCPRNGGLKDARFKPAAEDMARTGCERVLVFLAGRDKLKDAGRSFYEELNKCGWEGNADMVEHDGVGHVFHLIKPRCEQALDMMKRLVSFINQEPVIISWRSKI
ncbi:carboxylesterase [Salix suchowensis]|nr:carboxylesterase [Salix suchowensis]